MNKRIGPYVIEEIAPGVWAIDDDAETEPQGEPAEAPQGTETEPQEAPEETPATPAEDAE